MINSVNPETKMPNFDVMKLHEQTLSLRDVRNTLVAGATLGALAFPSALIAGEPSPGYPSNPETSQPYR